MYHKSPRGTCDYPNAFRNADHAGYSQTIQYSRSPSSLNHTGSYLDLVLFLVKVIFTTHVIQNATTLTTLTLLRVKVR
jgi:hypothetical protein